MFLIKRNVLIEELDFSLFIISGSSVFHIFFKKYSSFDSQVFTIVLIKKLF